MPISSRLRGASSLLQEAASVSEDAILEDVEEEVESMQADNEVGDGQGLRSPNVPNKKVNNSILTKNVAKASEDVVVKGTSQDYARCVGGD